MRLILASSSPRRAELLAAAGFIFEVMPMDVDERVRANERPDEYVRRLAAEKSALAMERLGRQGHGEGTGGPAVADSVVLGADTSVVLDGRILGKPTTDEGARSMLRRLSGRAHDVLTGVSVRCGPAEVGCVETTAVFFAELGDAEIAWYVQTGEGRDKAGAYAVQGLASRFVRRIEGSYANVVGLPVATVHQLLKPFAGPGGFP